MTVEVDFVPIQLLADCERGAVKVIYNVVLETGEYRGFIGGAEVEAFDDAIEEAVKNLTDVVISHLRDKVGLEDLSEESPLGSNQVSQDDEDPL